MMIYPLALIEALKGGVIGILLTLDTLIYGLISSAFRIFMAIAGARLLSSDVYYEIANKVYIVVGVLMLFVLAYALLKGIVDPDQTLKNELGPKTVKNIIIAVVGLAITPVLFNLMYQAQGLFLEQDILAKIFFRSDMTETIEGTDGEDLNPDEYVKHIGGAVTAVNIWQAFFYPAEDSGKEAKDIVADADSYFISGTGKAVACVAGLGAAAWAATIPVVGWIVGGALAVGTAVFACAGAISDYSAGAAASEVLENGEISLEQAYQMASAGEDFGIFTVFLKNYADEGEITYLFGISTIAGAFVLYAFISFSIDMGIRAGKLAFLQIIAPVPLVMNILPKSEKRLEKYISTVVSTFMEVFIRIAVVYVIVFIICHLTELFSSVGGVWGNAELGTAEKLFALAFLILGLIAFSHTAPGFITSALGLEKGTMDGLGLKPSDFRKKLADGGAFNAYAMGRGGLGAGLQRWNDIRQKKKDGKLPTGWNGLNTAASLIGAAGSGVARAAASGFGPEKIDSYKKAKDAADNAANAAMDAARNRADNKEQHEADVKNREKARAALDAAQLAVAQATRADDETAEDFANRVKKLQEDVATAQKNYDRAVADALYTAPVIGQPIKSARDRLVAWSTGSISTEDEEEYIKFGTAMDALKGKLRDEAYAKDARGAQALKNQYEALKSQPLPEYVDGWDEQSANAELRSRRNSLVSKSQQLSRLSEQIARVEASGPGMDLAELGRLRTEFNNVKTELEGTISANNWDIQVEADGTLSDFSHVDLIGDIRIDPAEARAKRASELEGLRLAMEAAADAWVQENASDPNGKVATMIGEFVKDQAVYMSNNRTRQVVTGYDDDKNPITEALGDVLTKAFGEKVFEGKYDHSSVVKSQTGMNVKLESPIVRGGRTYDTVNYKLETRTQDGRQISEYVPYITDSDGNSIRLNDTEATTYAKADFFEGIRESVTRGKFAKVDSKTSVAVAADIGKTSANHVKNNDLAEKIIRKRQLEETKRGNKS